MPLFGKKTENYLGIDIGSSSIKLVEIEHVRGKPHLKTYGFVSSVSKEINENGDQSISKIAQMIKLLHKQSQAQSINAVSAIPNYSVFSSILTLPKMGKKELEQEIKNEAKKLIPKSINEMILDWKILEEGGKTSSHSDSSVFSLGSSASSEISFEQLTDKKFIRVLLTATSKELVKRYMRIFKEAGLNLVSLETEPFALTRSLLGKDKSTVVFVDMGGLTTDVALISQGIPLMSRSINVGGNIFSSAIARYSGLSQEEAEGYKIHMSYYPRKISMPQVLKDAAAPTLNELKYTIDLFGNRTQKKPEKIILTGEASLIPGLDEYFTASLNVKSIIGDPFFRIHFPEGLDNLLDIIGSRFSVAIGLAMRGFD